MDRFAQFFLSPTFTESATKCEVMAVDLENCNYQKNDLFRLLQLERSLANPKHDYAKFGVGSKQTLMVDAKLRGLEPRDELLRFHKDNYSSNLMGLTILGKESLDTLEEMAVSRFAGQKMVFGGSLKFKFRANLL